MTLFQITFSSLGKSPHSLWGDNLTVALKIISAAFMFLTLLANELVQFGQSED